MTYEIIEELLESLIAYTITSVMLLFFTKVLSTFLVIGATQTLKRFIYKFVYNLTYKKGSDKMEKLKEIFLKIGKAIKSAFKYVVKSNPRASLATIANGLASAVVGSAMDFTNILQQMNIPKVTFLGIEDIFAYLIAIGLFLFIELLGIKYAFETNETADKRKAVEKAIKQEKTAIKEQEKAEKDKDKKAMALAIEMIEKEEKEKQEKITNAEIEKLALDYVRKLKQDKLNSK